MYPSNMNECNDCGTKWGTAPGGTPPKQQCPNCGSTSIQVDI